MSAPHLLLSKYSIGTGDRFGHQARAQLKACMAARDVGVAVTPVWNKSHREHTLLGSEPDSVLRAAREAAVSLNWTGGFHVDADHINLSNVDRFISSCDFYTIDVADFIGRPSPEPDVKAFVSAHPELCAPLSIEGIRGPLRMSAETAADVARHYLAAAREAGRIYRHVLEARDGRPFITEVSMDETAEPQTPPQLLAVLAALADEEIPAQTIAPKFSGHFHKGVDYAGDVAQFAREFHDDIAVVTFAVKRYDLPANLKLSVHSGSDKFSIYGAMRAAMAEFGAGIHLKTAGTSWLEEVIGLAEAGAEGLDIAKWIYSGAWRQRQELCEPYSAVIDIDPERLPSPSAVDAWDAATFASALRHDAANPAYNPHLRQLLHVGYKVAADMGSRYLDALRRFEGPIGRNVTANLLERHIRPVFL